MCGIGGQIRFDGEPVQIQLLEKMSALLEHRGRDDSGIYLNENVGFLHRRLSIIDLSDSGRQPMFSGDNKFCIIFNGEIFNYRELRDELASRDIYCETTSDTEVLLKSYMVFGLEVVHKIDGMFAFAILDRERQIILLVRDRMGIKPLYYHYNGNAFTFASEIKALVSSGVCPFAIDPIGLKQYLHIQLYLRDTTLFKGIHSLQPGHYMTIDLRSNKITQQQYWDVPELENNGMSYGAAIENLQELLASAVTLWSRADVPIAAYVSGGIDSSSVAALAKNALLTSKAQPNLLTYSSVFPNAKFKDEQVYSDAVALHINSDHRRVQLPLDEVISAHDDLLYVLDMPIAGYSAPYRVLSRVVRKEAKVVLTGHGGDELFCGYPKYIGAALAKEMSDWAKGIPTNVSQLANLKYIGGFEKQIKQIIGRSAFGTEQEIVKSIFYRSENIWDEINPELKRETKDYDVAEAISELVRHRRTGFLKKLLYLDLKVLLPGLLHVEDRTSMIENLESRTPLLDRRIVEFASSIPEQFLLQDGLKGMTRTAVKPLLPRVVTENPSKSGTMYPAAELFENEFQDRVANDLGWLDKSELFMRPVAEILKDADQLVSKRLTWAMWSLGNWLKSFQ
jgi:asparagine synthase (glutamine-hydrolysing)